MSEQISPQAGDEAATFLPPEYAAVDPIGFAAAAILQSQHSLAVKRELAAVAGQLVQNPLAMQLFCDRVYELLQDDLRLHRDRSPNYGRG